MADSGMKPIETMSPSPEIMKFFTDYMMKGVTNLNTKERAVYVDFLKMMIMQRWIVDPSKINLKDLIDSNKPGAIVRRTP